MDANVGEGSAVSPCCQSHWPTAWSQQWLEGSRSQGFPWHPGTADFTGGSQNPFLCLPKPPSVGPGQPRIPPATAADHAPKCPVLSPAAPVLSRHPAPAKPARELPRAGGTPPPQPPAAPQSPGRIKASVSAGKTMCCCVRSANKVMFCLCPPFPQPRHTSSHPRWSEISLLIKTGGIFLIDFWLPVDKAFEWLPGCCWSGRPCLWPSARPRVARAAGRAAKEPRRMHPV